MKLIKILLIVTSLFHSSWVMALSWQVKPITCVVQESGQRCTMDVDINITDIQPGAHCLHFLQKQLKCWAQLPNTYQVKLNFNKQTELILQDSNGAELLKQSLYIKSVTTTRRRRIRAPWSIF